jgi:hypothetical protein
MVLMLASAGKMALRAGTSNTSSNEKAKEKSAMSEAIGKCPH